ncbi:hypothetical protein QF026_001387 [Streptomyces aurantiacus]|nr:hypothetical protein [Streptomyces aurantiacus]
MSRIPERVWHVIGWLTLGCVVLVNVSPGLFGVR